MFYQIVRRSRVRLGKRMRFEGAPAILAGIACIICAAGVAEALKRGATAVPDVLRETRELWIAVRGERRSIAP